MLIRKFGVGFNILMNIASLKKSLPGDIIDEIFKLLCDIGIKDYTTT